MRNGRYVNDFVEKWIEAEEKSTGKIPQDFSKLETNLSQLFETLKQNSISLSEDLVKLDAKRVFNNNVGIYQLIDLDHDNQLVKAISIIKNGEVQLSFALEINGEHASIRWDLHDLHRLEYFDHRDDSIVRGWRSVDVTDGDMPYMDKWWVPGLQIGYEHTFVHQVADFLKSLEDGEAPAEPTFRTALETQKVCDAVLKSAASGSWETV